MLRYYIIINFLDIEPELRGPYKSGQHRLRAARRYAKKDPQQNNSLIRLTIHPSGRPEVEPFWGYEMGRG